jgi:SAM-dependent methyltransferase
MKYKKCRVVRCVQCGQRRTYPEPNQGETDAIYNDGREKYNVAIAEDFARQTEYAAFGNGILSDVERFAPARGRLLDVGCNFGDLLTAARGRGWDAQGLEVNQANVHYLRSRGFQVFERPIEQATHIPENYFDVVVTNNVLEHVTKPAAFVAGIKRVLRPGGLLFVGVPIFWGPIPVLLKRDQWYSLLPDEHVWQYSQSDVLRLVRRFDFSVLWQRRGCSGFWGKLSLRPKDVVRWSVYKSVKWSGLGDFISLIAINQK